MQNLITNNINHKIIYISILGILGFLFFLLLVFIENIEIEIALVDALLTTAFFITTTISLWYQSNYLNIENNSILNLILNNFLLTIFISLLWLLSSYYIVTYLFPYYETFFFSTLLWRFSVGTLLIVIIIILNYVIMFYNNLTEKISAESELNSLIAEAELKSLKYQINPHFIFNSLNSISSLTISDPEKAQEMSINLSEFLRKTLAGNDVKKISLDEELKNVELYLKIEKVRFENRLDFNLNISDECRKVLLPNMILQPLIENCIKHGVYESSEIININLKCERKMNNLEINISNNFDSESKNKTGKGIGLQNINSRLKLIYNESNLISINKRDNIFTVILLIPVE
jgi:two-component system, LytTR family, sensor kinase